MAKKKKNKHSNKNESRDGLQGEQQLLFTKTRMERSSDKKHGGNGDDTNNNTTNNKFHKHKKKRQEGDLNSIPLHKRQKLEDLESKKARDTEKKPQTEKAEMSFAVVEEEEDTPTLSHKEKGGDGARTEEDTILSPFVSRLIVVAGTYDGVLVGWDSEAKKGKQNENEGNEKGGVDDTMLRFASGSSSKDPLQISFALAAHEGSVRALEITSKYRDNSKQVGNDSWKEKEGKQDDTTELYERYPCQLISAGYDEFIRVFDLHRRREAGEARSPAELGTPLCLALAPPPSAHGKPPTHAVVGLTSGKLVLYSLGASRGKRKEDPWSVVHVMSGHGGSSASGGSSNTAGVSCVAVHPSGKLALTGGRADGTIRVWDLMRGRLAYVHKLPNESEASLTGRGGASSTLRTKMIKREISHIQWSKDGGRFAFCYGCHLTVREMTTGDDLLDVELSPKQKINGITFLGQHDAPEGLFVAVVCDNGSLCVFCVGDLDSALNDKSSTGSSNDSESSDNVEEEKESMKDSPIIRGIEAIEGVDRLVAGNDRYKCIQGLDNAEGYLVATANTGGIISVINLEGAVRMLLGDDGSQDRNDKDDESSQSESDDEDANGEYVSKPSKKRQVRSSKQEEEEESDIDEQDDEEEMAAEILTSVRVGSGARITNIVVWSSLPEDKDDDDKEKDATREDEYEFEDPTEEIDTAMYSSSNEDDNSNNDSDDSHNEALKKKRGRKTSSRRKNQSGDDSPHKPEKERKAKKGKGTTSLRTSLRTEDILDANEEELANARKLVEEAKKRQKKAKNKKKK